MNGYKYGWWRSYENGPEVVFHTKPVVGDRDALAAALDFAEPGKVAELEAEVRLAQEDAAKQHRRAAELEGDVASVHEANRGFLIERDSLRAKLATAEAELAPLREQAPARRCGCTPVRWAYDGQGLWHHHNGIPETGYGGVTSLTCADCGVTVSVDAEQAPAQCGCADPMMLAYHAAEWERLNDYRNLCLKLHDDLVREMGGETSTSRQHTGASIVLSEERDRHYHPDCNPNPVLCVLPDGTATPPAEAAPLACTCGRWVWEGDKRHWARIMPTIQGDCLTIPKHICAICQDELHADGTITRAKRNEPPACTNGCTCPMAKLWEAASRGEGAAQ